MKTLWTPWRMEHVTGKAAKVHGCLFEPTANHSYDRDQLLLYHDSQVVVLLNRYPYANGHILVAPSRHVACLTMLETTESNALMTMIQDACTILKDAFSPAGLNVGCNIGSCAGAGIADHLHFHIIPRWEGDHNFMTSIAEIRTIPQHIDTTFDILLPEFINLRSQKK